MVQRRFVAKFLKTSASRTALIIAASLYAAAPARAQISVEGYLVDINSLPGRLSVLDTRTNSVVAGPFTVGNAPAGVAATPDGRFVYTADIGSNSVSIFNPVSRTVVGSIAVAGGPQALAASSDGRFVYVTSQFGNTVSIIDTSTQSLIGSPIAVGSRPVGVAVSPDGSTVYVTSFDDGQVRVIDATTRTVTGVINGVGTASFNLAVSPDGRFVYVVNENSNNVSVISTATNTVVANIPVGILPLGVAFSPDGRFAYVSNQQAVSGQNGGSVSVIDTTTQSVIQTIASTGVNTINVSVSPDGRFVYATVTGGLDVIDTSTNTVITTLSLGTNNSETGSFIGPNVIVAAGGPLSVGSNSALTGLGFGTFVNFNGGTLRSTGSFATARSVSLLAGGGTFDTNGFTTRLSGLVTGTGSLTKIGAGTLILSGANTYTGGTTISAGTVQLDPGGSLGTGAVTLNGGALFANTTTTLNNNLTFSAGGSATLAAASGQTLTIAGPRVTFGANSAAVFGTPSDTGTILFGPTNSVAVDTNPSRPTLRLAGGTLRATNNLLGGLTSTVASTTIDAGAILDFGGRTDVGATIANLQGAGTILNDGGTTSVVSGSFSGVFGGTGGLQKFGSGTLILSGVSTYTGATTIDGGTLSVNGSIASSSGVTVNGGGTLGGSGTVPNVVVNAGGNLSPGNSPGTITVNGNLTLASGATTTIEVQASVIDRVNVTGTASLGGTLRLVPLGGPYQFNTPYTFLQAATRTGTFATVSTIGSFGVGVSSSVTYTATGAQLTLTSAPLIPSLLPQNTQNRIAVAGGLDNAVLNLGGNATPFFPLYNSSAAGILVGLDQLSGQAQTGAGPLGTLAAGQFLSLLTDSFGGARVNAAPPATAYAPTRSTSHAASRAIEVAADLAAEQHPAPEAKRYAVWGALTGGGGPIGGNGIIGSHRRAETNYGVAVGADIALAPGLAAGVALSGGQADARLAGGLGTLGADVFQAGLYTRGQWDALKLGAALAYSYLDLDSNRGVPVLGLTNLNARYGAHGVSGRLEGSYAAWTAQGLSLSPVAAIHGSIFRVGGFTERAGPFGVQAASLTAGAREQSTLRGEVGLRVDAHASLGTLPAEAFVRAAWGLYGQRDASFTASFAGFPGSAFTITGAQNDVSTALFSAGLDLKLSQSLTLAGRFDGEYGARTARSAGTARLKLAF